MEPVRVLLVDDNPTFLRIAARFLEQEHCQEVVVVGTATGGEDALAKAKHLAPQVVLLDLMMPGMNGLEVIPRLKAMLPEVYIVALTLLDTSSYRSAALSAGADAFIAKTAMNTELLPAIRRVPETRRVPVTGAISPSETS